MSMASNHQLGTTILKQDNFWANFSILFKQFNNYKHIWFDIILGHPS